MPEPALPSGEVTFLLSDIEGSTRLFHRWGSAYAALLDDHRRLLREAVAGHGGVEVDTEGDAVLSAFPDAGAAVGAALVGQQALSGHAWPEGGEVRVRMGLHTGEAEPQGGGYVSLAVHQVARICAAAHGGQVLVSQATAEAADLPADADLLPLGSFQLRGFPAPVRLSQLRHPALRADFPQLRAAGAVPHNLPRPRTALVGRGAERGALAGLLRSTGIVTVVGPAGVGKTRLSLEVALDALAELGDGAFLVELSPLRDPALVAGTLAAVLRVGEQPGRLVEEVLAEALAAREMLLLLDNCEHLLDAVAELVDHLTAHCPRLTVLATSREPLDVDGEVVWRLSPLPTSGQGGEQASDAARLFADRAALVRPGFTLDEGTTAEVEELVAHLDGLPLAVELAAAALADRPLSAVLAGLSDRFSLLDRGRRSAPARHRTLRAALEWSLDLLAPAERTVLARLSVFSGSGTPEAAAAVCSAPPVAAGSVVRALRRLVRASLLLESGGRWSMPESVRDLAALELAASGEADDTAGRHRRWFADRAEALEPSIGRSDRPEAMRELAGELDNVRGALDSAVAADDADTALRLGAAVAPFWTSAGRWREGAERLGAALALPGGAAPLRGRALAAAGQMALLRGDLDAAADAFGEAGPLVTDDVTAARVLSGTGFVAFRRSRLEEAELHWRAALERARTGGDPRVAAGVLRSLAIAAGSREDQDRAQELLAEAVAAAHRARDGQLLRQVLGSSAEVALWLGEYVVAAERFGDALDVATGIGDLSSRPLLLAELGWVALLRGDVRLADRLAVESAELAEDLGNRRVLVHALRLRGEALVRRGCPAEADALLERALVVAEEHGAPAETAGVLCSQALAAYEACRYDAAAELAERARALSGLPHTMRLVPPRWVLGAAALGRRDPVAAEQWFTEGLGRHGRSAVRHEAAARWGLGWAAAQRGRTDEAVTEHLRALRVRVRIGDRLGTADSLVGLAAVVDPAEAARLAGAAEAVRERAGAVATPRQAAELAGLLPDGAVATGEELTPEGVEEMAARLGRTTEEERT